MLAGAGFREDWPSSDAAAQPSRWGLGRFLPQAASRQLRINNPPCVALNQNRISVTTSRTGPSHNSLQRWERGGALSLGPSGIGGPICASGFQTKDWFPLVPGRDPTAQAQAVHTMTLAGLGGAAARWDHHSYLGSWLCGDKAGWGNPHGGPAERGWQDCRSVCSPARVPAEARARESSGSQVLPLRNTGLPQKHVTEAQQTQEPS